MDEVYLYIFINCLFSMYIFNSSTNINKKRNNYFYFFNYLSIYCSTGGQILHIYFHENYERFTEKCVYFISSKKRLNIIFL